MNSAPLDKSGFGYESPNEGQKTEWLTPQFVTDELGPFDLDPCSPIVRPWPTAARHLTIEDDGLATAWGGRDGRVWLNPPYTRNIGQWLDKMAAHGNGIVLIFARTETTYFKQLMRSADAFYFLPARLKFHHVDGSCSKSATAPSVLVAFDNEHSQGANAQRLRRCALSGPLAGGGYFGKAEVAA